MPRGGGLQSELEKLPGDSTRNVYNVATPKHLVSSSGASSGKAEGLPGVPSGPSSSFASGPFFTSGTNAATTGGPKTLQQVCREEIENLHGIFVCWFKGLQPKEELEKELLDRITSGFSHIAPNGQFLKGRSNLLLNLTEKYNAYPSKAFDIQIENVKVIWTQNDLCLVTYEEWQWWRDIDMGGGSSHHSSTASGSSTSNSNNKDQQQPQDDVIRFGRLSSCLLKQRPGNFQWIHVHETWLEGLGPNEAAGIYQQNGDDDNNSESSGSYNVEVTYKTGAVDTKKKKKSSKKTPPSQNNPAVVNGVNKEDGEHHVRFSAQREEVSYAYKKVHHDKPEATSPEASAPSSSNDKKSKSKSSSNNGNNSKLKEKRVVQLTPVPTTAQAPSNASRRRHISPQLTDFAKACMVNNELIGISIHGWDIGTGQGPMGDEGWFAAATTNFENVSQYRGNKTATRRRLALPEMVFPAAHVAFEHRKQNLWISWDVLDSLDDWAKAHQLIPVNSDKENNGVSVLKSEDAELWAKNKNNKIPDGKMSTEVFHFDWTYSSPFCGSVEGGFWDPLPSSGLKLDMLKDKSVPILFFDELVLYEDDLHDNGHVQYSLKIRVMPTCGFVLARLWVRIDRVMLRLRETRVMFEFGKTPSEDTKIFRDVTWRECPWKDLGAHKLPTNLKVWCSDGHETPQLAMLMSKLPEVELPKGISKYAALKRGGNAAKPRGGKAAKP
ncbi:TIP41-like protein [Seminavis robusta]|uniref:TIP41-like protein n=1 Tax=Seminavis robusta TaxID=568900 RepID=A0A9N8DPF9_9STRA|nr:TIP41-like protein [Seminavis robusta]|eukprot:Sro264_g102420.1 TIP41-like protein (721) ;mRNA; f:1489-3651